MLAGISLEDGSEISILYPPFLLQLKFKCSYYTIGWFTVAMATFIPEFH